VLVSNVSAAFVRDNFEFKAFSSSWPGKARSASSR